MNNQKRNVLSLMETLISKAGIARDMLTQHELELLRQESAANMEFDRERMDLERERIEIDRKRMQQEMAEVKKVETKEDRQKCKGDFAILHRAICKGEDAVNYRHANQYLGLSRSAFFAAVKHLDVVNKGQNKKITIRSLLKRLSPTKNIELYTASFTSDVHESQLKR